MGSGVSAAASTSCGMVSPLEVTNAMEIGSPSSHGYGIETVAVSSRPNV
ncbi:MAG: hypothetical protein M3381_11645 [Actinomycetota bacterium]|nr:hypothetical protein [Actinomycetota bacterium]